jgi:carbon storage regulator CsrA
MRVASSLGIRNDESRQSMLVISRRKGERILIGDDIEIVVVEVSRSGVRLGVRAPPSVVVLRDELAGDSLPARK